MMLKKRLPDIRRAVLKSLSALLLLLLLAGCTSVPSGSGLSPFSKENPDVVLVSRETPHPSITVETWKNKSYPVIWHLVTIQLSDPDLSLTAAPLSTEGWGTVKAETTADFAKRTGAIIAVNASPFSVPDDKPLLSSAERQLSGLFISDGVTLSDPKAQYGALGFTRGKRAFILESQTSPLPEDTCIVLGGFWVILKDGEHYDSFRNFQDSRTAAGISEDGMTLWLLSAEGERPLSSRGMSYFDCAEVLMAAGATDAVELDGGGSASLIIQGVNRLSYPTLRPVANSLGIVSTGSVY